MGGAYGRLEAFGGLSSSIWRPVGAVLGASWGLGRLLGLLGAIVLGGVLGLLGLLSGSWGALGASWGALGGVLGPLGRLLDPLEAMDNIIINKDKTQTENEDRVQNAYAHICRESHSENAISKNQ